MSFTDTPEAQRKSPLPHDPDIVLLIRITVPNEHELRFVACMSAALRFAVHWAAEYPAATVSFELPRRQHRRLPCERLWTLP
ncbi:hypothetical protein [Nocardia veterana]|uniref:Uncharacterized protein n=1 Tax=Nocardia veterana TaxID=132249 RepID=A0A7X6M201_9NOCA|nr:hypothetical protein [Nocardia veterana]NKY88755.1 hypothetical protein [Nocardia veterana]